MLTFDIAILDEAQKISNYTTSERILPMLGGTNGKIIKIGTPKSRNHFYDSVEGKNAIDTTIIRSPWWQCDQLSANGFIMLPDHTDPEHKRKRKYSTYVLSLMPKRLKLEYFPLNPEIYEQDGEMSVVDFQTQYILVHLGIFFTKIININYFLTNFCIKLINFNKLIHNFN